MPLRTFSILCSLLVAHPGTAQEPKGETRLQIEAGTASYEQHCTKCHSENLVGGAGPPLRGEDFESHWNEKPMRALYNRILMTMPGDEPGSLTTAQVLDLVSYITRETFLIPDTAFKTPDELTNIIMRSTK
jgi:mono/diheme cytochrome c family protein